MYNIKKDLLATYDTIAKEFSASRLWPWPELQVFIPYIQDGFKVLDLGCGNGRLVKALEEGNKKFDYLGVDFSPSLIKYARAAFSERDFKVADISKVDFAPASFDAVFMIATFHHLDTKKDRQELLKKINIWLKPGGFLIMTNWNLWQKKYLKDYFKNFWQKKSYKDFFVSWQMYSDKKTKLWRYYYSFSQRELEKLLLEAGFVMSPKGVYKSGHNINCLVQKSVLK